MRPSSDKWVSVLSSTAVAANAGTGLPDFKGVAVSSPKRDFNIVRSP